MTLWRLNIHVATGRQTTAHPSVLDDYPHRWIIISIKWRTR